MRSLSIIAAIASNGVIGKAGALPWSYPQDRKHFDSATLGHVVIMGRRTWEETRAPLTGRCNIVVSRTLTATEGAEVVSTLEGALTLGWQLDAEPFVIGGAQLFLAAMPFVTRALISEIPESPEGDTFLRFDPTGFRIVSQRVASGVRFLEYLRIS